MEGGGSCKGTILKPADTILGLDHRTAVLGPLHVVEGLSHGYRHRAGEHRYETERQCGLGEALQVNLIHHIAFIDVERYGVLPILLHHVAHQHHIDQRFDHHRGARRLDGVEFGEVLGLAVGVLDYELDTEQFL